MAKWRVIYTKHVADEIIVEAETEEGARDEAESRLAGEDEIDLIEEVPN